MKSRTITIFLGAMALGYGLAGGSATAQMTQGALLNYNADIDPPAPGCPGIQWRISRMGDILQGMMWYNDMSGASAVKGAVAPDKTATMTVTPVNGKGPQGTVNGHWTDQGTYEADMDGTGCSKMHVVFVPDTTSRGRH